MAKQIAFVESFLSCHVCSETFSDPVSLSCSHSFCSSCLTQLWEQPGNKNCPICKRRSLEENPTINLSLKELTILGSEGFSSGKHSWEVEVGDHPGWVVGLAKESVDRAQGFASPKNGFWCLWHRNGKYTNDFGKTLIVKKSLHKIRVQLHYHRGEVSFYNQKDMTLIYTYIDTFTEKLFPYLNIGKAAEAITTEIKICQSQISLSCSRK